MAAGALLGVYLLAAQLEDVREQGNIFRGAEWGWIAIAVLLSQTPQLAQSVAMRGSVGVDLPVRPVIAEQFANNFTGLVGGTAATTALVVRFFQKQGLPVAVAASSGVLNSLGSFMVQAVLLTLGLLVTSDTFEFSDAGGEGPSGDLLWAVFVVAALIGVVLLAPKLRRWLGVKLRPQLSAGWENVKTLFSTPSKATQILGGQLCSQLLFASTLGACLEAYGYSLGVLELVVVNSLASLVGGVAPVPGGMGVIEAGMIAGLSAAGVPEAAATSATFTHRLLTAYLPPIWGYAALGWLRRNDYV